MRHARDSSATILPNYISRCRWFGAKARTIRELRIMDRFRFAKPSGRAPLVLMEVNYTEGATETYTLPVQIASVTKHAHRISRDAPHAVIAAFSRAATPFCTTRSWIPISREIFPHHLRAAKIAGRDAGRSLGRATAQFAAAEDLSANSRVVSDEREQSNSSMLFEHTIFLKLSGNSRRGLIPMSRSRGS